MKRFGILFLLVVAFILNAGAQASQFGKKMKAFYAYCLDVRNGVQTKNLSALEKCIVDWDGDSTENVLKYNGVEMRLDTIHNVSVDTLGRADLKGHLLFSPYFVDSINYLWSMPRAFPKHKRVCEGPYEHARWRS